MRTLNLVLKVWSTTLMVDGDELDSTITGDTEGNDQMRVASTSP
jgi:hypothetical protein